MYAYLTHKGAHPRRITCVGHSLGAHICGMMGNNLSVKQHKIIGGKRHEDHHTITNFITIYQHDHFSGLDPARPLVENKSPGSFRLTHNDADIVQIIQTNAGRLGQLSQTGTLNYCVNGGREQPYCKGHDIRKLHYIGISIAFKFALQLT